MTDHACTNASISLNYVIRKKRNNQSLIPFAESSANNSSSLPEDKIAKVYKVSSVSRETSCCPIEIHSRCYKDLPIATGIVTSCSVSERILLPEVCSADPSCVDCLVVRPVGKSLSTLLLYRDGESRGQSMSGARWNKAVHKGGRVGAVAAASEAVVRAGEGERKEGRLSLASGNLQLQGYRAVRRPLCFFALSSLRLATRPVSRYAKARKTARRRFHELYPSLSLSFSTLRVSSVSVSVFPSCSRSRWFVKKVLL